MKLLGNAGARSPATKETFIMAILGALKIQPSESHPEFSDLRKKLRWLIGSPPQDLAKVMDISPAMATVMMERNVDDEWSNRPQSSRGLKRYAASMKRGWKLTGEPIIFSRSGRLLNGQHRLMASIESGASFRCLVVFGIEDDAFKFMDIGIARTAAHIFSIENVPNATQVAAGARLLFGYKTKQSWDGRAAEVENDVLLDFYYQHDRLQDALAAARILYSERLLPMRWGVFCFYICAEKNREQARQFFEQVGTGVGLPSKNSAAYKIRKRLLENARSKSEQLSESYLGAYFIQAWNCHRMGSSRELFRWRTAQSPNQAFPRAE